MMTIHSLHKALESPERYFHTLHTLRWQGKQIRRSTLFAEVEVTIDTEPFLLLMPLSALSMRYAERFRLLKRHLTSSLVPQVSIMRDELIYENSIGQSRRCDIILEPLPKALPLSDALATAQCDKEYAKVIWQGLQRLEQELRQADISLGNLREENLLIDEKERIYPIRWYYASAGYGADKESFDKFYSLMAKYSQCEPSSILSDISADYGTTPLEGHLDMRLISEGLIAVEDKTGWGFVDAQNNYIVEPIFRWVNDFREGRAEVEGDMGMGLIDRYGRFILEPKYKIVEYDHRSGQSEVLTDQGWFRIDYSGNKIEIDNNK